MKKNTSTATTITEANSSGTQFRKQAQYLHTKYKAEGFKPMPSKKDIEAGMHGRCSDQPSLVTPSAGRLLDRHVADTQERIYYRQFGSDMYKGWSATVQSRFDELLNLIEESDDLKPIAEAFTQISRVPKEHHESVVKGIADAVEMAHEGEEQ